MRFALLASEWLRYLIDSVVSGVDSQIACRWNRRVASRVVTIYRYDGIPRYKQHVRLSYCAHLLIYGIWRK